MKTRNLSTILAAALAFGGGCNTTLETKPSRPSSVLQELPKKKCLNDLPLDTLITHLKSFILERYVIQRKNNELKTILRPEVKIIVSKHESESKDNLERLLEEHNATRTMDELLKGKASDELKRYFAEKGLKLINSKPNRFLLARINKRKISLDLEEKIELPVSIVTDIRIPSYFHASLNTRMMFLPVIYEDGMYFYYLSISKKGVMRLYEDMSSVKDIESLQNPKETRLTRNYLISLSRGLRITAHYQNVMSSKNASEFFEKEKDTHLYDSMLRSYVIQRESKNRLKDVSLVKIYSYMLAYSRNPHEQLGDIIRKLSVKKRITKRDADFTFLRICEIEVLTTPEDFKTIDINKYLKTKNEIDLLNAYIKASPQDLNKLGKKIIRRFYQPKLPAARQGII